MPERGGGGDGGTERSAALLSRAALAQGRVWYG